MNKTIVILNGPPGCGKDTIQDLLTKKLGVACEMKKTLFDIALEVSGIGSIEWFERYNNRELKEKPWHKLGGLTQREFLIKISEDWVKPVFGKHHFGLRAGQEVAETDSEGYFVFSDGGFDEEIEGLRIQNRAAKIIVVQLHGRGDWGGDSRTYIEPQCADKVIKYYLTDNQAFNDARRIAYLTGQHKYV